ncbi:MAG: PhoPQ-activated pathogenicity-like protein PqaA type [Thermotogae bacterium]|nr:PhoPQ-activated pathogenicity-like protein PqaA type [Thermotogota bacterium]
MRSTFMVICFFTAIFTILHISDFAFSLDEYIAQHSKEVDYSILEERDLSDESKFILLLLHSQCWKGIDWYHRVGILLPKDLKVKDAAVLYVTGGFEDPEKDSWIANAFGAPFIILGDEPNQPLFANLREDRLIAYTFQKFFETGEKDWPLLLPMVDAAIATMDVVQDVLKSRGLNIKRFLVSGASKRGWTTWLTAAVDKRVFAIAPIVFDNLNFEEQLKHQLENWGNYSEKISPYTELEFQNKIHSELGKELLRLVDPYSYLERLNIPKLIIEGTNDRYWPVDASWFYFFDLKGENYLLFIPNEGHNIKNIPIVVSSISEFFKSLVLKNDFVEYSWDFKNNGEKLIVYSQDAIDCNLWIAFSNDLDFRNSIWTRYNPSRRSNKHWEFCIPNTDKNICYFAELLFKGLDREFVLTTVPKIVKKANSF